MGENTLQCGCSGAKPKEADTTGIHTGNSSNLSGTTTEPGCPSLHAQGLNEQNLNILTINVRGIESNGRLEQIRLLLIKNNAKIAVLSETETTHSYASTTNIEGWRAFCPPECVSGPSGKEVVANDIASASIKRPDINGTDTVQTVWIEITSLNILIGGVYRRNKPSQPDLEREELNQLINQTLKAAQTGKSVLLLGDLNLDHQNPNHKKKTEAADLLSAIESANMKHMPTDITWKSDGLFKVCKCAIPSDSKDPYDHSKLVSSRVVAPLDTLASCDCPKGHRLCNCVNLSDSKDPHDHSKLVSSRVVAPLAALAFCGCPKGQRTATIDNAYISRSENATAVVLENGISDHFPVKVSLEIKVPEKKPKLKTIWRRDFARIVTSDLEMALNEHDWSPLYQMNDPNEIVSQIVNNITESLDIVAPLKAISFRPDKPKISLKRDTLEAIASRDCARKHGSRTNFKVLRNKVNRLVKRDKINDVLNRLKRNPGSQAAWQEAKNILGRGKGEKLPDCTNNSDPSKTADHQNEFFVKKVEDLVASLSKPSQKDDHMKDISDEKEFGSTGKNENLFSFRYVTAGDVTRIIRGLNNTKAEGVDNIPTSVLKKGIQSLPAQLLGSAISA